MWLSDIKVACSTEGPRFNPQLGNNLLMDFVGHRHSWITFRWDVKSVTPCLLLLLLLRAVIKGWRLSQLMTQYIIVYSGQVKDPTNGVMWNMLRTPLSLPLHQSTLVSSRNLPCRAVLSIPKYLPTYLFGIFSGTNKQQVLTCLRLPIRKGCYRSYASYEVIAGVWRLADSSKRVLTWFKFTKSSVSW